MSVAIAVDFLAGRYHATPWDHQVNEGTVEWPPSSWRVLRALIAASYRLTPLPERQSLLKLMTALSRRLPVYSLPKSETAHTRHYFPVREGSKITTTRVFDTFLVVGDRVRPESARLVVAWPDLVLDPESRELLGQLCAQVTYLGRAESWAELSIADELPAEINARPLEESAGEEVDISRLMAPLTPEGWEGFSAAMLALPAIGKHRPRVPKDLLEALEVHIGEWQSAGWSGVPGARWVAYHLKLEPAPRFIPPSPVVSKPPVFARFALFGKVLPRLTRAVAVGERLRMALMALGADAEGRVPPVFSGRDADGKPRTSNHAHAWFLSEDIDGDGRVDHFVVYARDGFCERATDALQRLSRLRRVWGNDGYDLDTALVNLGTAEDYAADPNLGRITGRSPVVGSSSTWRSLTPVVLPRFPKYRRNGDEVIDPVTGLHKDGPEHQIRRLLQSLGKDEPVAVEPLDDPRPEGRSAWWAYQRRRSENGGGVRGPDRGYGFILRFHSPQSGPIALGYAAHFGLGLFVPMREP